MVAEVEVVEEDKVVVAELLQTRAELTSTP
jgi:hypothetical protein